MQYHPYCTFFGGATMKIACVGIAPISSLMRILNSLRSEVGILCVDLRVSERKARRHTRAHTDYGTVEEVGEPKGPISLVPDDSKKRNAPVTSFSMSLCCFRVSLSSSVRSYYLER